MNAQTPQYTIQDLGDTSSTGLYVFAINQQGSVVGYAQSSSGIVAFRTAPNAPINLPADSLGTLGGKTSVAYGINSSGQVVGQSDTASGASHAFRTAPNAAINAGTDDLGTLRGGSSTAYGINDSGQVAGTSDGDAFLTAPNSAINPATDDIGALSFTPYSAQGSGARSVNAAGTVAGFFETNSCGSACYPTAFVYSNGTITEIPEFINAPFGNSLTPINNANQVVDTGHCSDPSAQYPCSDVWQNGTITSLAQCDCATFGLNNSLQVVGQAYGRPFHGAFLYTNGTVYDLTTLIPPGSGWVLTSAVAINDSGQIIGTGQLNGINHVFRMDPVGTILISPTTLLFGPQDVGTTSSAQFVTVTNNGSAPLNFTMDTVTGDFALAGLGTCPASLAPGANCTISIHFTPTAAGNRTGMLSISDDAPNSPQLVNLIGTGGQAQTAVTLSRTSLTFAAQDVGTTSSAQFVTVNNIGIAPVTFTQDTVSGDFALAGLGTCGTSLAPGANCTISINFTPITAGTRTGTLTISDNAPNSPQTVSLTGTGGQSQAAVSLSPSSLTFAAQTVGTTSGAQFVTVTNTGSVTLTFTGDTVSGDFALAGLGTCGTSLAPGANCTISINFTPSTAGTRTGTLTVNDNAPNSPQTVSLTGTGGQSQAAVSLSPTSMTFAAQAVGTTSSAEFVTVTNTGSVTLTFTGDTVSGDFALAGVGTCGTSLAPGANCTISIHFTPTATGTRTGALTIPDNAPDSPQVVPLSGTGQ